MSAYEPVIGLEVHAQLRTQSKLFCGCSTAYGASPNAHTCEVCLGMPGALPVLNGRAVSLALRVALALECTVHGRAQWSRKNYFYPDLPKGYQITQNDQPLATAGCLRIDVEGVAQTVGITRIHMEEDAGKNVHDDLLAGDRSYVDFNRGGTPLVEIVSEPDLRSSAAAATYLKTLRQVLRYLGACDGNMEEGSLRCDANVSLRPVGAEKFGTRVELKNINSFRFVAQAIDYEIARQVEVLKTGGSIVQQTRQWDAQAKMTRPMRDKEEAHDYRYFPEPDLPDLCLTEGDIDARRQALPELPADKAARFARALGLSAYDARLLCEDIALARYFEAALEVVPKAAKQVANWIINELLRHLKDQPLAELPLQAAHLGELVALIEDGTVSGKMAKDLFPELVAKGGSPRALVSRLGLAQASGAAVLGPWVDAVVAEQADEVAKYRAGQTRVLGFLVGQVMRKSRGQANPREVDALLRARLEGG